MKLSKKLFVLPVLLSAFLTACGGGSDATAMSGDAADDTINNADAKVSPDASHEAGADVSSDTSEDVDSSYDASQDADGSHDADGSQDADASNDGTTDANGCPGGCLIEGVCYATGSVFSNSTCLHCDPAVSTTGWSPNDGVSCNDDAYCNGTDTCSAGACKIHSGRPCSSDETCLEVNDSCCMPGVAVGTGVCNSMSDSVRHDACGDEVIEDCANGPNGRCVNGRCGCADGYAGEACDACLIHVDGAKGADTNDGRTWSSAYKTVQAALDAAANRVPSSPDSLCAKNPAAPGCVPSCEVWVTNGTYKPYYSTGTGRYSVFRLQTNVAAFGGFAGNEIVRSARDITTNETILSGDIGIENDNSDNTYHVVDGADKATLDGFTITGGNANGASAEYGGGMFNLNVSPTVANCKFVGNSCSQSGAGMFNDGASPIVTNCTFSGNTAAFMGAGMFNKAGASPRLTNCVFSSNSCGMQGAGVANWNASTTLLNCTFSNNTSIVGAAAYNYASSLAATNCIFWDKVDSELAIDSSASTVTVSYSLVRAGYAGTGNLSTDPVFVDAAAGDLRLQATSPAIDAADGCSAPKNDKDGLGRRDIAAKPNTGVGAAVDMGASEYQGGTLDKTSDSPVSACCTVNSPGTNHKYFYCSAAKTWAAAEAFCAESGMHLVSISDSAENNIASGLVGATHTYIGGTDIAKEGTWNWSSGEAWSYTKWNTGEPNNFGGDEDCATIAPAVSSWNDVPCTSLYPFICESH